MGNNKSSLFYEVFDFMVAERTQGRSSSNRVKNSNRKPGAECLAELVLVSEGDRQQAVDNAPVRQEMSHDWLDALIESAANTDVLMFESCL